MLKYDTNLKSNTVLVYYTRVNEYKPESKIRKSPKNAEFLQMFEFEGLPFLWAEQLHCHLKF
jgi:hypothetical protein